MLGLHGKGIPPRLEGCIHGSFPVMEEAKHRHTGRVEDFFPTRLGFLGTFLCSLGAFN